MKKIILVILSSYYTFLCAVPFSNPGVNPTQMLHYLKKFLPDVPIILEAGANLGEDTKKLNTVWPQATIHVFEPVPWSFAKLVYNTKDLKNIHYYECALSTYCGETSFHIDIPNNGASSILPPVDFNRAEFDPQPIAVDCITLNEWSKQHNVKNIDFMWLDMEGHELYVLQNGLDLLDTVKVIYTEVNFKPVRQGSCLYSDLKSLLEIHDFVEIGRWEESAPTRFGNALFVKKELLSLIYKR